METHNIGISKLLFMLELADILDNHPSLVKITDENGILVIPIDRYEDFAHDVGVILARILGKICEPYDI